MKEILDFNHKSLLDKHNIIIKRQKLELRDIALMYKTSNYAMVFEDKSNIVEFYDVDLKQSQNYA